jgi:ribosomal protein S18 acetylase RimI-like enzyme
MISLRPITEAEFARWRTLTVAPYAADKVRTGHWSEAESLEQAENELRSLLPQGLRSQGHLFFTIEAANGEAVGVVWVAMAKRAFGQIGFVYDLVVWPKYRRQGYALSAMQALERQVSNLGLKGLALHVFGHNDAAQALYARLGFGATNINMFKPLPSSGV